MVENDIKRILPHPKSLLLHLLRGRQGKHIM